MPKIFNKIYDCESISDIFRDVSECLNPKFNDKAKILHDTAYNEVIYVVSFKYVEESGFEQMLISKNYDNESFIDLECDIGDSFCEMNVKKDENGFFKGDIIIDILV